MTTTVTLKILQASDSEQYEELYDNENWNCPEDNSDPDLNNSYFSDIYLKDEDYYYGTNKNDWRCNQHTQWDGDPISDSDSDSEDDATHTGVYQPTPPNHKEVWCPNNEQSSYADWKNEFRFRHKLNNRWKTSSSLKKKFGGRKNTPGRTETVSQRNN